MDPDLKAFYEYNSMHMEPWDGPGWHRADRRSATRPASWTGTVCGQLAT